MNHTNGSANNTQKGEKRSLPNGIGIGLGNLSNAGSTQSSRNTPRKGSGNGNNEQRSKKKNSNSKNVTTVNSQNSQNQNSSYKPKDSPRIFKPNHKVTPIKMNGHSGSMFNGNVNYGASNGPSRQNSNQGSYNGPIPGPITGPIAGPMTTQTPTDILPVGQWVHNHQPPLQQTPFEQLSAFVNMQHQPQKMNNNLMQPLSCLPTNISNSPSVASSQINPFFQPLPSSSSSIAPSAVIKSSQQNRNAAVQSNSGSTTCNVQGNVSGPGTLDTLQILKILQKSKNSTQKYDNTYSMTTKDLRKEYAEIVHGSPTFNFWKTKFPDPSKMFTELGEGLIYRKKVDKQERFFLVPSNHCIENGKKESFSQLARKYMKGESVAPVSTKNQDNQSGKSPDQSKDSAFQSGEATTGSDNNGRSNNKSSDGQGTTPGQGQSPLSINAQNQSTTCKNPPKPMDPKPIFLSEQLKIEKKIVKILKAEKGSATQTTLHKRFQSATNNPTYFQDYNVTPKQFFKFYGKEVIELVPFYEDKNGELVRDFRKNNNLNDNGNAKIFNRWVLLEAPYNPLKEMRDNISNEIRDENFEKPPTNSNVNANINSNLNVNVNEHLLLQAKNSKNSNSNPNPKFFDQKDRTRLSSTSASESYSRSRGFDSRSTSSNRSNLSRESSSSTRSRSNNKFPIGLSNYPPWSKLDFNKLNINKEETDSESEITKPTSISDWPSFRRNRQIPVYDTDRPPLDYNGPNDLPDFFKSEKSQGHGNGNNSNIKFELLTPGSNDGNDLKLNNENLLKNMTCNERKDMVLNFFESIAQNESDYLHYSNHNSRDRDRDRDLDRGLIDHSTSVQPIAVADQNGVPVYHHIYDPKTDPWEDEPIDHQCNVEPLHSVRTDAATVNRDVFDIHPNHHQTANQTQTITFQNQDNIFNCSYIESSENNHKREDEERPIWDSDGPMNVIPKLEAKSPKSPKSHTCRDREIKSPKKSLFSTPRYAIETNTTNTPRSLTGNTNQTNNSSSQMTFSNACNEIINNQIGPTQNHQVIFTPTISRNNGGRQFSGKIASGNSGMNNCRAVKNSIFEDRREDNLKLRAKNRKYKDKIGFGVMKK